MLSETEVGDVRNQIERAYDLPGDKDFESFSKEILQTIEWLDQGLIRVCTLVYNPTNDSNSASTWITHQWIKKAILLYFKLQKMSVLEAGDFRFVDKIPVKQWTGQEKVRVVPQAMVRKGAFVESGAILMPSYINIGAYVASRSMVDTWATVGSCAQIGHRVHLSGGVGIGGVLEPVQADPVIIEDDCFIGSRCIVVEGAHVEQGAVLGAGVVITASTKIIDVSQNPALVYRGRVPKNSVVIPGSILKKFAAGEFGVSCALIVGKRKESTDKKTSLTQVLREFDIVGS